MHYFLLLMRTALFHIAVFLFTLLFAIVSILFVRFIPYKKRFNYLIIWSRAVIFFAKIICGIRYHVTGLENIPSKQSYVVIAKHQSQWETFFLINLLRPISIVCKRELLTLPIGVGYGISLLNPISIDRSSPRNALKDIQRIGHERLIQDKVPVLIFPEGTRTAYGAKGNYARSGAALAITAGVPIILISLNSGLFWPGDTLIKYPGTIEVIISQPISSIDKTSKELIIEAETWIESNIR